MENEIVNKQNFLDRLVNLIKKKKKAIIVFFIIILIIITGFYIFKQLQLEKNKKISEKYVEAQTYLISENFDKSKEIYVEIILSKNKFYSVLALNRILENNLEKNSNQILNLFKKIEEIKFEKEQSDLIKFKKALYLIKISDVSEANKLLREIIDENSIWKNAAKEVLK